MRLTLLTQIFFQRHGCTGETEQFETFDSFLFNDDCLKVRNLAKWQFTASVSIAFIIFSYYPPNRVNGSAKTRP